MLKILRETIRHEDGSLPKGQTSSYCLQTIFFAAYSQVSICSSSLKIILISLGVLTAIIWLIVAIRNIKLIKRLRVKEAKILKSKGKAPLPKIGWDILSSNNLIGILFPASFLIGWVAIILTAYSK